MLCLLSAFLLCSCRVTCKYGSISRFKGVFSAVCGVCVGLYWFGALRGLCGFCVREWLGGLKACGVFCLSFLLLSSCTLVLLSCFRPALLLGFLPCLLFVLFSWLCGFCCFFFPYGLYAKRKGAKVLPLVSSLCVLWVLDSCAVIKEFRCRCFGLFQLVGLVFPTNTTGVRRLARSHFDFFRHYVDITYNCPAFLK